MASDDRIRFLNAGRFWFPSSDAEPSFRARGPHHLTGGKDRSPQLLAWSGAFAAAFVASPVGVEVVRHAGLESAAATVFSDTENKYTWQSLPAIGKLVPPSARAGTFVPYVAVEADAVGCGRNSKCLSLHATAMRWLVTLREAILLS